MKVPITISSHNASKYGDLAVSVSHLDGVNLARYGAFAFNRTPYMYQENVIGKEFNIETETVTLVSITSGKGSDKRIFVFLCYETDDSVGYRFTSSGMGLYINDFYINDFDETYHMLDGTYLQVNISNKSSVAKLAIAVFADVPFMSQDENTRRATVICNEIAKFMPKNHANSADAVFNKHGREFYANANYAAAMFAAVNIKSMNVESTTTNQYANPKPQGITKQHSKYSALPIAFEPVNMKKHPSQYEPHQQLKLTPVPVIEKDSNFKPAGSQLSYTFKGDCEPTVLTLPNGWEFSENIDGVIMVMHNGKPYWLHVLADVENVEDNVRRFVEEQSEKLMSLAWAYKLVYDPQQDEENSDDY